jgi:hypothetical protein
VNKCRALFEKILIFFFSIAYHLLLIQFTVVQSCSEGFGTCDLVHQPIFYAFRS